MSSTGATLHERRQAIVLKTAQTIRSYFLVTATLLGGYLTIELFLSPATHSTQRQHFVQFGVMLFIGLITFLVKIRHPSPFAPNYEEERRMPQDMFWFSLLNKGGGLSATETWQMSVKVLPLAGLLLLGHCVSMIGLWDPTPGFIAWPEAFVLAILLFKWVDDVKSDTRRS